MVYKTLFAFRGNDQQKIVVVIRIIINRRCALTIIVDVLFRDAHHVIIKRHVHKHVRKPFRIKIHHFMRDAGWFIHDLIRRTESKIWHPSVEHSFLVRFFPNEIMRDHHCNRGGLQIRYYYKRFTGTCYDQGRAPCPVLLKHSERKK